MNVNAPAKPTRVLFLHPSDELYGADIALLSLLRGLNRTFFEPVVMLANDVKYNGLLSRELRRAGIETTAAPIAVARRMYLTPTGLPNFLSRVRSSVRLVTRFIRDERIDLVHTNTLAVWTGALAAKRTGRSHIWHIHESLESPPQLVTLMRRFVPSHSARVVGVSRAVMENILVTPEARAKGEIIYNGIDPYEWMIAAGREEVRRELRCGPNDVVVGMIARVSKMKGTDLFVQAMTPLLAKYPWVHCFIAGGAVPGQTQPLDEVRQLVANSATPERFHLLGERRDAAALTAATDVLAAPSRYGEGASLSVIQAMFAGKPTIVADVGGNKELVANGETGWVIPRANVEILTQSLESLLLNPRLRRQMGAAGQQRALEYFTLDRAVWEFNDLLWRVQKDSLLTV